MSSTISPNMNLVIPTVGGEPGPNYALDINSSLSVIDQHNHAFGNGVQITPSGLDINSDLAFNTQNATLLRSARFVPQSAALALPTDLGAIYVAGLDLYYNNTAGTAIRLTQNGSIVGTAGSISGLPSGTASASYASGTFVWESATSTGANMDFASAILRNATASSHGLTLEPPSAMTADYTITLPSLPSATNIVTMDTSGNLNANLNVDNSSIIISSNQLTVGPGGITPAMLSSAIAGGMTYQVFNSSGTFTAPAGVNAVFVDMWGGGGGGGGGFSGGEGGGGAGGARVQQWYPVVPGTTYNIIVGSVGGGGYAAGAAGGSSQFDSLAAPGGNGGFGSNTGGGGGPASFYVGAISASGGAQNNMGQNTYIATGGGGGAGWLFGGNGGAGGNHFGGQPGSVANSGSGGGGGGGGGSSGNLGGPGAEGRVTVYYPSIT